MEKLKIHEIPDFQTIMLPLLEYYHDNEVHSTSDTVEYISNAFNLSEE